MLIFAILAIYYALQMRQTSSYAAHQKQVSVDAEIGYVETISCKIAANNVKHYVKNVT